MHLVCLRFEGSRVTASKVLTPEPPQILDRKSENCDFCNTGSAAVRLLTVCSPRNYAVRAASSDSPAASNKVPLTRLGASVPAHAGHGFNPMPEPGGIA